MRVKKFSILLVILVSLSGCSQNSGKKDSDVLVSYSQSFVMEDSEAANGYYDNREEFIQPYFSVKYLHDTIVATTLHEINACGKTDAQIIISGDTLFLQTINNSKEVCASIKFHKYTYVILNPSNKRFIVKG